MQFFLALAALALSGPAPLLQQPAEEKVLVEGQVLNAADGLPVPRGTVVFSQRPFEGINLRLREGRFSGQVPAGEGYWMSVWAPGFTRLQANNINIYQGMEPILLQLRPTTRINGQIVDPDGAAIAEARVLFSIDPQGAETPLSVLSRQDGSFSMDVALKPGTYYLLVRHPLFEDSAPVSFSHSLTEEEELVIELSPKLLGPTGTVEGRATLAGLPLADVEIFLHGPGEQEIRKVKTDQGGAYAFAGLSPGAYRIQAVSRTAGSSPDSPLPIEVKAGQASPVLFTFEGSAEVVSGTVFGPAGDPLFRVRVSLLAGSGERQPVSWFSETDKLGRFEIRGVMPGSYQLRLLCGPPRSDCPETRLTIEVPLQEDLEIHVEESVEMRAALLDADGEPIGSFHYSLGPYQEAGSGFSASVESLDGLFVIRGLTATTYRFGVSLHDGREAEALIDLNAGTNVLLRMPSDQTGNLLVEYVRE